MIKKLQPLPFDPHVLDDDFALDIDWTPARGGGASFVTARLSMADNGLYYFRMSSFAKIFWGFFGVIGLLSLGGILYMGMTNVSNLSSYWMLSFPVVFLGLAGYMLYKGLMQGYVIDPFMKTIYKGKPETMEQSLDMADTSQMRFDGIYALQLIKERVRSKNSSYTSYELNLIHKDKTRTNLIDHGKYDLLREDAEMLASILNVPLWDTIESVGK